MAIVALLSDRAPQVALPALGDLLPDLKVEPLAVSSLDHLVAIEAAGRAGRRRREPGTGVGRGPVRSATVARIMPVMLVVERDQLERYPWAELADEFVYPGAPAAELRVRLAMLRRRAGAGDGSVIRLGPLALDTETYRVTASGRALDLTFKEFELLRYLATRPGRVFTRPTLLREVWGYDFYGGTRTVDVHVRRLRAKLGPEHEHLIETVRSVGYRAAEV